jgi:PAS domain S-box-containing protein
MQLKIQKKEKTKKQNILKIIPSSKEALSFPQMQDAAPEPILITNNDGLIYYVNPAWEKLTGYTLDDVRGTNPRFLQSGKTKNRIYKQLWNSLSEGKSFSSNEIRNKRKDGTEFQIHATYFPIRQNNKNIFYVQLMYDITEYNTYVKSLFEKEAILEWIINNTYKYAIFMVDKKGFIKTWNTGAENVMGYKSKEILGKHFSIFYPQEEIKKKKPQIILKKAEKNDKYEEEGLRIRKDGTSYWAHVVISPIRSRKGVLKGFVKITQDITEKKEIDKQKDAFIGIASHELKTPITTLSAYTQLLESRIKHKGDTKDLYLLSNILLQTNRLTNLIDDLLHVSRIQSGKLELSLKKIDLNELIRKVIIDFQYLDDSHEILKSGKINGKVLADENRIRQVLINFLTNAIKYSPDADKIIIHLTSEKHTAIVSVQDFGTGISKEDLPNLFTRFYRSKEKNERNVSGFGLGLYISSEIVKKHKGRIWVESKKGKGSTFFFSLPLK